MAFLPYQLHGVLVKDAKVFCIVPNKPKQHRYPGWVERKPWAGPSNAPTPTTTQKGLGHAWRKVRDAHLLEHPFCQWPECGKYDPSAHVDHIIPRSQGGSSDPSNLQTLCLAHHKIKTADDKKKYAKK